MSSVRLVTITPDAEKLIAYCARVSSPHQDNPEYAGLLKYCIKHGHWSVFEQATATFEVETSVAISLQMIRHKSFDPQQLSRRYTSEDLSFEFTVARKQAEKNRQSSSEPCEVGDQIWWQDEQQRIWDICRAAYNAALARGIAREQARFLLPQGTGTRLYWTGNIRSFIHWIQLRTQPDTQLEHRQIAEQCRDILAEQLPTIAEALSWPK